MRSRVGARISPGAPYARHCSPAAVSRAGSQLLAASSAFCVTGMLETSPLAGVTIRQRQSSLMTATQLPVRSIGACARADGGCCGAPPPRPWAKAVEAAVSINAATHRGTEAQENVLVMCLIAHLLSSG